MSYDVQTQQQNLTISSNILSTTVTGFVVNPMDSVRATALVVLQGGGSPPLSHVRIKRPDGTWGDVIQVVGVKIRKADGTWVTFT